jgi:hypothetical protein
MRSLLTWSGCSSAGSGWPTATSSRGHLPPPHRDHSVWPCVVSDGGTTSSVTVAAERRTYAATHAPARRAAELGVPLCRHRRSVVVSRGHQHGTRGRYLRRVMRLLSVESMSTEPVARAVPRGGRRTQHVMVVASLEQSTRRTGTGFGPRFFARRGSGQNPSPGPGSPRDRLRQWGASAALCRVGCGGRACHRTQPSRVMSRSLYGGGAFLARKRPISGS